MSKGLKIFLIILAVFAILAIGLLVLGAIATPIMSNTIKDGKRAVAARTLEGYVTAIELATMQERAKTGNYPEKIPTDVYAKNGEKVNANVLAAAKYDSTTGEVTSISSVDVNGFMCSYTKAAGATCN